MNFTQTTAYNEDSKYFKDDEIYRIGIEFLIIMDSFLNQIGLQILKLDQVT
jgi:hypothetical protein